MKIKLTAVVSWEFEVEADLYSEETSPETILDFEMDNFEQNIYESLDCEDLTVDVSGIIVGE